MAPVRVVLKTELGIESASAIWEIGKNELCAFFFLALGPKPGTSSNLTGLTIQSPQAKIRF